MAMQKLPGGRTLIVKTVAKRRRRRTTRAVVVVFRGTRGGPRR